MSQERVAGVTARNTKRQRETARGLLYAVCNLRGISSEEAGSECKLRSRAKEKEEIKLYFPACNYVQLARRNFQRLWPVLNHFFKPFE